MHDDEMKKWQVPELGADAASRAFRESGRKFAARTRRRKAVKTAAATAVAIAAAALLADHLIPQEALADSLRKDIISNRQTAMVARYDLFFNSTREVDDDRPDFY